MGGLVLGGHGKGCPCKEATLLLSSEREGWYCLGGTKLALVDTTS